MKRLTVYTATYNRAYTLHKGYEALCRQTCQDFLWLIVDDGSTDNTKELVEKWIKEDKIEITYYYQENSGVNVARNLAIEMTMTELNVCVDSDDYLTDTAVEDFLNAWDERGEGNYAGVIGYDCFESGKLACMEFPVGVKKATLFELYEKYCVTGDKKMMYRTDLCKKYPCPTYPGEKYYPNRHKYYMIDREAPCILLRKPVCIVEYLPDGITASRYLRYLKNPKGLAEYRLFLMNYNSSFLNICRQSIHYVAMNLIAYKNFGLKRTKYPIINLLVTPLGIMLYIYIKYQNR